MMVIDFFTICTIMSNPGCDLLEEKSVVIS